MNSVLQRGISELAHNPRLWSLAASLPLKAHSPAEKTETHPGPSSIPQTSTLSQTEISGKKDQRTSIFLFSKERVATMVVMQFPQAVSQDAGHHGVPIRDTRSAFGAMMTCGEGGLSGGVRQQKMRSWQTTDTNYSDPQTGLRGNLNNSQCSHGEEGTGASGQELSKMKPGIRGIACTELYILLFSFSVSGKFILKTQG